jgi:uncharacterized OB-fold protein
MYKVIGKDGRQYGPITAEELKDWIAENYLNAQSLVQIEGTQEWRALATLPEFVMPQLIACKVCQTRLAPSAQQCPQCGQHWPTLYISCPYCDESDFEVVESSRPWVLVPASITGALAYALGSLFTSAIPQSYGFQCNRCGQYFRPPES